MQILPSQEICAYIWIYAKLMTRRISYDILLQPLLPVIFRKTTGDSVFDNTLTVLVRAGSVMRPQECTYIEQDSRRNVYACETICLAQLSMCQCIYQSLCSPTLTINLMSLVTPLPMFMDPSLSGLSATCRRPKILLSSIPTPPAIFARRS